MRDSIFAHSRTPRAGMLTELAARNGRSSCNPKGSMPIEVNLQIRCARSRASLDHASGPNPPRSAPSQTCSKALARLLGLLHKKLELQATPQCGWQSAAFSCQPPPSSAVDCSVFPGLLRADASRWPTPIERWHPYKIPTWL